MLRSALLTALVLTPSLSMAADGRKVAKTAGVAESDLPLKRDMRYETNFRARYLTVPSSILDIWFFDNDDDGANPFARPNVRAYAVGGEFVMKNKEANAQRFLQGNSFPAYRPAWKDKRLLAKHEYFGQSMGDLLVDLADEIPPVVVDPRRPQAIFMMQENYFGSVMFGAISSKEALDQYLNAMKKPAGPR